MYIKHLKNTLNTTRVTELTGCNYSNNKCMTQIWCFASKLRPPKTAATKNTKFFPLRLLFIYTEK